MHHRNLSGVELDVALHKLECGSVVLHVKVESVIYRYNRLPFGHWNAGTKKSISR